MKIFRSTKRTVKPFTGVKLPKWGYYCFAAFGLTLCVDVGFFPLSSTFSSFLYFILDDFFHLFCYLVVMSLPVYGPTKRQQQTMTTTTTTTIRMYLYTKCQLSFALLLTCSLTSMLSTVHVCVCVNCRHIRSSGREAMLVTHSIAAKRNGKEGKGAKHKNEKTNKKVFDRTTKTRKCIL